VSGLDDDVAVLDLDRKGLGDIGLLLELFKIATGQEQILTRFG